MKEITKENIEKLENAAYLLGECGSIVEQLAEKKCEAEKVLHELEMDEASEVDWCDDFSSFETLSLKLANLCTDYECELEFEEDED